MVTEACFQSTPLDFASETTQIRYVDGSERNITIPAVTTNVGTFPVGSMWRKNPVPMCNCDLGYLCKHEPDPHSKNPDDSTMFRPYNKTNFHPGQSSRVCPTGAFQRPLLLLNVPHFH